ncbi:glycoside hydrolase family protein [Colwellia sp. UCD-KL20]|uniref:glycoside hydrolase family protein n=1 Tax=Colwellia sp. UCD-KL20 TaxID=1917165 RepID=UPI000970A5AC|nr:glycoside hydrolase family protein [Colwellia sp. UCD-KL20]
MIKNILLLITCCWILLGCVSSNTAELDISQSMQTVPDTAKFIDPDYYIWGSSMVEGSDGKYHLFYSRWHKSYGHNAWLTHSEIAHAVADKPLGPYKHVDIGLPARGKNYWDGLSTHNPTVHKFGDKYYIYYMGNTGDGKVMKGFNFSHRNNQRIGVAVANSPYGPWKRTDTPLINTSENNNAWDALMVSNPSVLQKADGSFLMVYKAVAKKAPLPAGGPVVHLMATAKSPIGPFTKHVDPVFTKVGEKFPAEDPYIWLQGNQYWAIVKDMKGAFTDSGKSLALFNSQNGFDWHKANMPLVSKLEINWQSGKQKVAHLERPQIWFKEGKPAILFCAADETREHSYNVHIPLIEIEKLK